MFSRLGLLFLGLVSTAAVTQHYAAFDAASASSTYSAGNLGGSPAFAAQQALSGGSGYWCSSGNQAAGQGATWTGTLHSRRVALGVKVDWAYSPGEVKVLTSSDGSNFEEAKCWQPSTRSEAAFEQTFMFDAPRNVKAVTMAMRSPQSWGYFGINSAVLIAEPGPLILVSGITSVVGEQCLVASTAGLGLEPCLDAVAAGDGREVMQFDEDGQIVNMADGRCLTLVDGDTIGGGALTFDQCSTSASSGDGRTVFAASPNGQLKMPRIGNYCLTLTGGGGDADIAQSAVAAASSSNIQHGVKSIADANAQSYWASGNDPKAPVDLQLDFGTMQTMKAISIEWEHPAQAFELQVSSGGHWTSVYSTSGNNAQTTNYVGPAILGSALRIRMTTPHPTLGNVDGHALYGIRNIRVSASSARAVVQDCMEAEGSADARDKLFMVAVPEFEPRAAFAARQNAALLRAAEERLGILLAELHSAMPNLSACGFKASIEKRYPALVKQSTSFGSLLKVSIQHQASDATSAAVAAVAPAMGVDMQALHELVATTRDALTQVSR